MAYYGAEAGYPLQPPFKEGLRSPHSTGILIAIGGHADSETLTHVVSSPREGGRLFVATLASREPEESYEYNSDPMVGLGAAPVHIGTRRDLLTALDKMDNRSVVFLGGGNQQVLMEELTEDLMEDLGKSGQDQLRQAHKRGITIAGTSAGAMVLGDLAPMRTPDGKLEIINGLGLIPGVAIDTHFTERERISRLREVTKNTGALGIGLDEGTGFIMRDGEVIEVIGKSGVHVVRAGLELDLTQGDRFHLGTRQVISKQH